MIKLINNIEKTLSNPLIKVQLNNNSLQTIIECYSDFCSNKIKEFSEAFNSLFKCKDEFTNILNAVIVENSTLFDKALNTLNNDNLYTKTKRTAEFNNATVTTSIAKCTKDKNYYIIKCYDYFIYIFDKNQKKCFMIIKNNKKAITMINILLLTPYLMYGELYAVHGGLINKGKNNILINNSSLGGKTTFAILFASHGWNIITEETTYITSTGNILPYNIRNYFNIRVGTYISFKDFFLSKKIINEKFLAMNNLPYDDLFDYGKLNQFSIDFDDLGSKINNNKMKITHSLKVSIDKSEKFKLKKCSPIENVKAFLELSLAPTVCLFQELLDYNITNQQYRYNNLIRIFKNTKSFILKSGLDYKENYSLLENKLKEDVRK